MAKDLEVELQREIECPNCKKKIMISQFVEVSAYPVVTSKYSHLMIQEKKTED